MLKLHTLIEYGFYFLILLLPWQTRLIWQDSYLNNYVWEYGRFSLYGIEIFLIVLLLLYGVWLVQQQGIKKLKFDQVLTRLKNPAVFIYWLIISFVLVSGLSIIWSLNADLAYIKWIKLLEVIGLFSAVVVFNFKLERIAAFWVASSVIQSLFAIWQFFVQYTPANKWLGLAYHFPTLGGSIILETTSERWLRAYGSLPHPNILAGFLLIGLMFLLYLAFKTKSSRDRLLLVASLTVIVPALFFSFSRSAWIAIIVILAMLLFWLFKHKYSLWKKTFFEYVLLILIIVSVLGITLSEPLFTRILGTQPLEVNSIELRFTFTEQAFQLIQNNLWTGTGIGNYTLGVYQQINASWPGYYYQPVHNIYLLVLAEVGILGFILFISILILLLYYLRQAATSLEKAITALIFLGILIIGIFDHYFWSIYSGMLMFWIILALNLKHLK